MSIVSFTPYSIGQSGVVPARKQFVCTDSLATVTTAGYLNRQGQVLQGLLPAPTDIFDVFYGYTSPSVPGTYGEFLVSISAGVITLTLQVDTGNVLLPVVNGNVAEFNGTTGQIKDSGIAAAELVQLNAANTFTAGGSIILNKVDGTEATNAVTADGVAGAITTSSLTTAGGASYAITWTNTSITATSVVLLTLAGGTNTTENITLKCVPGAGSATLTIYNNTTATALNGTIIISYAVL